MASRDTLHAFQARLAERLQAAHTQKVAAAWLAVEAGPGNWLLPLADTGEIFPWTPPQAVPHTAPWFLGVANLRGGLHGVARLEAFAATAGTRGASDIPDADLPAGAAPLTDFPNRSGTQDDDPPDGQAHHPIDDASPDVSSRRLVALHARFEVNCALLVDRVLGLRAADAFEAPPSPPDAPAPDWVAGSYVDAQGRPWRVLDLQALSRHTRFLNVGA
jgi:twitching motility protein PilI